MSKYSTTRSAATLPLRSPSVFPVHRGKGIIVTGAAGGIGRAIVAHLLEQGASVAVADLREEAVADTVKSLGGKSHAVAMDMGSQQSIAAGIAASEAALGRIDGLPAAPSSRSPRRRARKATRSPSPTAPARPASSA